MSVIYVLDNTLHRKYDFKRIHIRYACLYTIIFIGGYIHRKQKKDGHKFGLAVVSGAGRQICMMGMGPSSISFKIRLWELPLWLNSNKPD